jgi:hypothetical protein
MSGHMEFNGRLVWSGEAHAIAALDLLRTGNLLLAPERFVRRDGDARIDHRLSGPVSAWESTLATLDEIAGTARGGRVRCRLWVDGDDPDEDIVVSARGPLPGEPWSAPVASLLRNAYGRDRDALESDRSRVRGADVDELLRAYRALATWDTKLDFAHAVQDQKDPRFAALHLDVLEAPAAAWVDDYYAMAKAAALCFFEGSKERFMEYLEMRDEELHSAVRERLEREGLRERAR